MTDRKTASTITDTELDQLYDDLATLRAVARGYCPHCGRGDATPPVAAYEQQRAGRVRAEAATARTRALHQQYRFAGDDTTDYCTHCNQISGGWIAWPCPTIRALDEEPAP